MYLSSTWRAIQHSVPSDSVAWLAPTEPSQNRNVALSSILHPRVLRADYYLLVRNGCDLRRWYAWVLVGTL